MAKTFMTTQEIIEKAEAGEAGLLHQVRRDQTRTAEYKQVEIARSYLRMAAERDRLLAEREAARRDYQRQLEAKVFGAPGNADASWAISRRDADDRVSKVDNATDALDLLARAERQQDEPLARAIAERAYEMRWPQVADAFLESRPQLNDPFTELWTQTERGIGDILRDGFTIESSRPPELAGLSDSRIKQLAERPL